VESDGGAGGERSPEQGIGMVLAVEVADGRFQNASALTTGLEAMAVTFPLPATASWATSSVTSTRWEGTVPGYGRLRGAEEIY
jgi:hypothetical protein